LDSIQSEEGRLPVLLVEDEPETRLLYEKYLRYTAFQSIPAGSIRQGREALRRNPQIAAIVLDILLPDEMAWHWLAELKGQPATKHIPVFIISSIDDAQKGLALGADDYCIKPVHRSWLVERLERAINSGRNTDRVVAPVLLLIDDQEADRYLLSKLASETGFKVVETAGGEEGLSAARKIGPSLILLDLNMPNMDGFEVLAQLREDLRTKTIPVIVVTSQILTEEHINALQHARAILRKSNLSPQTWRHALEEAKFDLVNLNETVDSKERPVKP
jgi:CheY-like chemotaxis protein